MKPVITFLSFIILSVCFSSVFAQLKQVAIGPSFAEPEDGFSKILNMKNGNTVYMHFSVSDGIHVRIYDAKHVEKASTNTIPSYGKLKWSKGPMNKFNTDEIYSIFEVNNDVLVFMTVDVSSNKNTITRLLIDGTTGKIKEDAPFLKMGYVSFMAIKDQVSDHYAIAVEEKKETGESMSSILLMGSDHKEIRRISLTDNPVLDEEHKESSMSEMLLINDRIYAFFFALKNKTKRGVDHEPAGITFMAISESGTGFSNSYVRLKLPAEMPVWGNGIKYNASTKKIYVFTMKDNYSESYKRSYKYQMYFNIIDPESKDVRSFEDMSINAKINDAYKERFSKKDDYLGMAQNLYINDDGSFSLICEERMMGGSDGDNTWLGKVLQSSYDKDGNFRSAYIVPKFHNIFRVQRIPFSGKQWEGSAQTLQFGSQYKFFIYLDGMENKYILFNDLERNNNVKDDKYAAIAGVEDCDTYIYKLSGNELVPPKIYAFGEPGSKEHNMLMLSVSDYDRKNNTLVSLKLDTGDKNNKTVKLVWLQPAN